MLKLLIGNKAYSSWSLRGWLACKQSGLPFEEVVVPLYDVDWDRRREAADLVPSAGKVPILWDGEAAIWDSLAILDWLADRVGRARFWPEDAAARGMARSIAAEMHAGFAGLRRDCTMNVRRRYPAAPLSPETTADVNRILQLWAEARARFSGTGAFLFDDFGAADIMFAPVATRFVTYAIPLPSFAEAYCATLLDHPFLREWLEGAREEAWIIDKFEQPER